MVVVVLEPLDTGRTLQMTFTLSDLDPTDDDACASIHEGLDFVKAGAMEDREMVSSVQRGLAASTMLLSTTQQS